MDIGFVWDQTKYEKVIKDHGVKFFEVVGAFEDPDGFESPSLIEHEERWIWVGKTLWNRLLVIVYTDEDLPLYRTIMAFDAEGRLHDEYYQR